MLRIFANAFRAILAMALVVLAIVFAPAVGKAFAHSRAGNVEAAQPVVEQSCSTFEVRFLDPACDQVHVKKAVHAKHRLAHK